MNIIKKISDNKFSSFVIAAVVIAAGYWGYQAYFAPKAPTTYITASAEKGTLVVSVTGTGQVSASDQIDLKPKASGTVTYIAVKEGQAVYAGQEILKIDSTDAEKSVRDAQVSLDSANLDLQKLKQSSADTAKITEDAFTSISSTFLDLPAVVSGAQTIITGSTIVLNQENDAFYHDFVNSNDQPEADLFITAAKNDYDTARKQYDDTLSDYKTTSRFADAGTITALLDKTAETTKSISQALISEQNLLDYLIDYVTNHNTSKLPNLIVTYRSNLQTYIGEINTHLSDLTNLQNTIKNAPLDISSSELSITQRANALQDAKDKLADYVLTAPFDGVIAKVNAVVGDSASAGAASATLITKSKLAEISLNEVDVAKVKPGEKVTLTFDALPDLSIAGSVASIDTIGTVSQGVVTYNVKVGFETADASVKPGMSVSAAIITDVKQDVIIVPNSAVKSNNETYVQVLVNGAPVNTNVTTGLSNDTDTEITSGLNVGDNVVTQTIAATSAATAPARTGTSLIPGLGGGGARGGGGSFGR